MWYLCDIGYQVIMTTVAQFDGQQFSEEEVAAKVMEQYDGELVRKFYKIVMGRTCCTYMGRCI